MHTHIAALSSGKSKGKLEVVSCECLCVCVLVYISDFITVFHSLLWYFYTLLCLLWSNVSWEC